MSGILAKIGWKSGEEGTGLEWVREKYHSVKEKNPHDHRFSYSLFT
jgi:hypothetical protein